jgi:hypothetical protein
MPELETEGDIVADGRTNERSCLNCGCVLVGDFCHCCGQNAHVNRTLGAWWHSFVYSVLHLDGKFWRTLAMLAWTPGELTRRYAHGERARFVSPLALFLFTVFLMFAVFSMAGGVTMPDPSAPERVAADLAETERNIARLEQRREEDAAEGRSTARLDERLSDLRTNREVLAGGDAAMRGRSIIDTDVRTGWARLDQGISKANANPSLLLYKVQANAYKFSWALIPISVPFLWILFLHRSGYRRELTLYDHMVFVTYSIAFMSLALVALVGLGALGLRGAIVETMFLLVPPLHMYRHLRGAYRLSRWSAAWRTVLLLLFATIALALFATLLLLLGALA